MSAELETRILEEIDRIDALRTSDLIEPDGVDKKYLESRRHKLEALLTKVRTPKRPEPTRGLLIDLCAAGIVTEQNWSNRDSYSAQRQLGEAWALLKAGCEWWPDADDKPEVNDTYRIRIEHKAFTTFEEDHTYRDVEYFYIPTSYALSKSAGKDWY